MAFAPLGSPARPCEAARDVVCFFFACGEGVCYFVELTLRGFDSSRTEGCDVRWPDNGGTRLFPGKFSRLRPAHAEYLLVSA